MCKKLIRIQYSSVIVVVDDNDFPFSKNKKDKKKPSTQGGKVAVHINLLLCFIINFTYMKKQCIKNVKHEYCCIYIVGQQDDTVFICSLFPKEIIYTNA